LKVYFLKLEFYLINCGISLDTCNYGFVLISSINSHRQSEHYEFYSGTSSY